MSLIDERVFHDSQQAAVAAYQAQAAAALAPEGGAGEDRDLGDPPTASGGSDVPRRRGRPRHWAWSHFR